MKIRFAAAAIAAIAALSGCGYTTIASTDKAGTVNEAHVELMTTMFESRFDATEQTLMCSLWSQDPDEAWESFNVSGNEITQTTFNAAMVRNCS
jgi:NAD(P)H-hydrate repair Nnr-like enzyme with NAD(P)H-hydrate dehydratase domain